MVRLYLLLALLVTQVSFAQKRQGPEKVRALKTAHITQELDLSPEEAQRFWPVYNRFQEQLEKLRRQERAQLVLIREEGVDKLSRAQADELVDKLISLKVAERSVHKDRIAALRKILSPQKVLKLQIAEEDFKRLLLNRFRGRRGRQ